MKKRYLFVWEGIWSDYTSGIAFALAENLDDAHEEVGKLFPDMPWKLEEVKNTTPTIINVLKNYANGVSGGG